mmetsp:Transcript_14153/g.26269  ORF Transcript_14153/g.26269 Transcript_14153/m.26269 type:complete len:277 (+) Transcript_14153:395-1225(+)
MVGEARYPQRAAAQNIRAIRSQSFGSAGKPLAKHPLKASVRASDAPQPPSSPLQAMHLPLPKPRHRGPPSQPPWTQHQLLANLAPDQALPHLLALPLRPLAPSATAQLQRRRRERTPATTLGLLRPPPHPLEGRLLASLRPCLRLLLVLTLHLQRPLRLQHPHRWPPQLLEQRRSAQNAANSGPPAWLRRTCWLPSPSSWPFRQGRLLQGFRRAPAGALPGRACPAPRALLERAKAFVEPEFVLQLQTGAPRCLVQQDLKIQHCHRESGPSCPAER